MVPLPPWLRLCGRVLVSRRLRSQLQALRSQRQWRIAEEDRHRRGWIPSTVKKIFRQWKIAGTASKNAPDTAFPFLVKSPKPIVHEIADCSLLDKIFFRQSTKFFSTKYVTSDLLVETKTFKRNGVSWKEGAKHVGAALLNMNISIAMATIKYHHSRGTQTKMALRRQWLFSFQTPTKSCRGKYHWMWRFLWQEFTSNSRNQHKHCVARDFNYLFCVETVIGHLLATPLKQNDWSRWLPRDHKADSTGETSAWFGVIINERQCPQFRIFIQQQVPS